MLQQRQGATKAQVHSSLNGPCTTGSRQRCTGLLLLLLFTQTPLWNGCAGKKKPRDAAKLAETALKAQSTADQAPVPKAADSFPQAATTSAAPTAAITATDAATTSGVPDATLPDSEPVHAQSSSAAGQATSKESPAEAEAEAVKQTQQGQEGVSQTESAREERSQPRKGSLELPLSLLLTGVGVKKRGRPYKNAANAERAAQRDARRAANEAAEKAAYQAASEAAQVVLAAPPSKKRRGRPPKDPAKLAAALAAYHANAHARQANTDSAEEAGAGLDNVMEAAQAAAAQASAAAAEPAVMSPPQADVALTTASPRPAQKKRGRPPKSIARAVADSLQLPSDSVINGGSHFAMRPDSVTSNNDNEEEDDDDHQALLDAAAVLTSDLPFPQGVRRQTVPFQQPKSRQPKGRRRSGSHAKAAVQSKPAAAQGKQARRGLELVSSRATALLDSISPDPHGPVEDRIPSPQPHSLPPGLSPLKQGDPPIGSDSEAAAPPVSGHPSKRQRKHYHRFQQPDNTAAAGTTEGQPQATPAHPHSPPLPGPQTSSQARNDITQAQRDDSSAIAVPTGTASSPSHHAPPGSPVPHTAPGSLPPHAAPGSPTPHAAPGSPPPHSATGEMGLEPIEKGNNVSFCVCVW